MHRIIPTKDGSNTIFDSSTGESLHSVYGALTESQHIFIQSGFSKMDKDDFSILEIGFGTGLNAILSLFESIQRKKKIFYYGIENNPPNKAILNSFFASYPEHIQDLSIQITNSEWNKPLLIESNFTLHKAQENFLKHLPPQNFDIIFFDPFSPEKTPMAWEENFLQAIYDRMKHNGILITYSSKGVVKQRLRSIGLQVQRLEGPPGKRHIVLAKKC
jgi:tRNA U34 5-methylaminomethyl-2-thiouridine-forming methyltransferase MnmC